MCLFINQRKHLSKDKYRLSVFSPCYVKQEMVVYKVLVKTPFGNTHTPFYDFEIDFDKNKLSILPKINETYFSTYTLSKAYLDAISETGWTAVKSENAYHAYTDLEGAKSLSEYLNKAHTIKYHRAYIYKAIIPEGSLVWYGTDGDICSNQMIITKEKL